MTDWSLIGGNPAPGDVGALEAASGSVDQVREEASDYLQQIQGILAGWSGSGWSGTAAARFEQLLQGAARHLSQMETAHEPVGKALATHAATLSEQQPIAARSLQQAEQAKAKHATASTRQAAAKEQYAQATQAHAEATSTLARIEGEIAAAGADVIGALQFLLGEKQTAETRQSVAQEGMQVASGIIGKMEGWISEAESALSAAVKLADQVRSDVESSAKHALGLITDVDNDLHSLWHHVVQAARYATDDTTHDLEGLLVGAGHLTESIGREVVEAAPEIHALTHAWAEAGDALVDVVNDLGPALPIACVLVGAVAGSLIPGVGTAIGAKLGDMASDDISADVDEFAAAGNLATAGSEKLLEADGRGSQAEYSQDMANFETDGAGFVSEEVGSLVPIPGVSEGVQSIVDQELTTGHVNVVKVVTTAAGSEAGDLDASLLADAL